MENLSSFPLCHSSSPPKGLKTESQEGRAEGQSDGTTLQEKDVQDSSLRWFLRSPPIFLFFFFREREHFFFAGRCRGEEREPVDEDKDRLTHAQLSNCGCVLSYKCLCSYLWYLYPCARLRTDTLTPAGGHTCPASKELRSTTSGKTQLLFSLLK